MTQSEWTVDDIISGVDEFSADLARRIQRDAPFGRLTTYRVGGSATCAVEVQSVEDLIHLGRVANTCGAPVCVLGRGSNTLVADAGWNGVVVSLGEFADWVHIEEVELSPGEGAVVEVGGAVALPILARRMAALGVAGLEWMVGVPGSVGGAVRMNAGGHGADISDSLIDVEVVDMRWGRSERWGPEKLQLNFRSSALENHHVVVSARLQVSVSEPHKVLQRVDEIVRWRRQHQPGGQNCGSVFVNPVPGEVSAGELIDNLGLRGFRIGSAEVSEKHANFIQADSDGSADDVLGVMGVVRERVREATGFDLRSEVRLLGFDKPVSEGLQG